MAASVSYLCDVVLPQPLPCIREAKESQLCCGYVHNQNTLAFHCVNQILRGLHEAIDVPVESRSKVARLLSAACYQGFKNQTPVAAAPPRKGTSPAFVFFRSSLSRWPKLGVGPALSAVPLLRGIQIDNPWHFSIFKYRLY